MSRLKEQQRFRRRLLAKIMSRSRAGGTEIGAPLLFRERERYLRSHQVQSAALFDIWKNERDDEAFALWNAAQREPVIPRDYRRIRPQSVEWHNKRRNTSGHRKICCLSPDLKLWHVLARDLIVAQHLPRPHIGDWSGRGRDRQMDQLLAAINSRWQAVVCADIRSAFASVNIEAVYDLRYLPEPLVRRAIDYRTHRFVRRERSEHTRLNNVVLHRDLEVAPSGLMEGSPASNAIFSVLMDDLPDHLSEEIQVFTYCDNIILLAPSILHARRAEGALVRYLTGHRAGPFKVRSEVKPVLGRFDHLGYSVGLAENGVQVGLSTKNWMEFHRRLDDPKQSLSEAILWLRTSFPHLTQTELEVRLQTILDEAVFREAVGRAARC